MMFKKYFPIILVVLLVLYLTQGIWHQKAKEKKDDFANSFQLPVRVETVRQGSLQEKIQLPADILALSDVKIIPTFLGRIESFYVKEGDLVSAGDKLFKYMGPAEGDQDFFDDLIVRSPIDGVVSSILKDVGAKAEKDIPIMSVAAISQVKAVVDLPSEYNTLLSPGTSAELVVDAYPGKIFAAKLKTLRPQIDTSSRTTYAEFNVSNPEHILLPGMSGTITFKSSAYGSGVIVPMESIFVQNDQAYVFINNKGLAKKRKVKVIQEGVEEAVVQGELSAGMQVLSTRADTLQDGDSIVIVK